MRGWRCLLEIIPYNEAVARLHVRMVRSLVNREDRRKASIAIF